MRKIVVLPLTAALLVTIVAAAAVKPETAIRYRQSVYTMMGWNFVPLVDMIKNKTPWDGANSPSMPIASRRSRRSCSKVFRKDPTKAPTPRPSPRSGKTWTTSRAR